MFSGLLSTPLCFQKREENEALTCACVLLQATDTKISSGVLADVCVCVCGYTEVRRRARKETRAGCIEEPPGALLV